MTQMMTTEAELEINGDEIDKWMLKLEQAVIGTGDDAVLTWADGRAITPQSGITGSVDTITALSRHEVIAASQDSEGNETISNIALLIGTGNDGLLGVVEVSTLTASDGVFAASKETNVGIQPFWQPTPVS